MLKFLPVLLLLLLVASFVHAHSFGLGGFYSAIVANSTTNNFTGYGIKFFYQPVSLVSLDLSVNFRSKYLYDEPWDSGCYSPYLYSQLCDEIYGCYLIPLTIGVGGSIHYDWTYLGGGIGFNRIQFSSNHYGNWIENDIGAYITGGFLIPLAGPLNLDTSAFYNYTPLSETCNFYSQSPYRKIGSLKHLSLRVGGTLVF
jgi:hypothetical protein